MLAKGGIEDSGTVFVANTVCVILMLTYFIAGPLAQDFDLRAGSVTVTVPADTVPGTDYAIVRECTPPIDIDIHSRNCTSLWRLW